MFRIALCYLMFCVAVNVEAAGKTVKGSQKTIGILPFENMSSDSRYDWLSAGISDTLIAKFAGTDKLRVVEREKVSELLMGKAAKKATVFSFLNQDKPENDLYLLGAEYLLTGSFVVSTDIIRINARIIHTEKATINGATVLTVQGNVADIFALETELAEKFTKACLLEVSYNKLSYTDGKNTISYRMFNEGKVKFECSKFEDAIDLFIQAQQHNDGFYFPETHSWEGKARIALANATEDLQKKDKIHADHVTKFEKDASEAAPAYYDLGVALQACGQYEKAIKTYDDYLRWYDKSARPFRWEDGGVGGKIIISTEEAPYYYSHGKREREQCNSATSCYESTCVNRCLKSKPF